MVNMNLVFKMLCYLFLVAVAVQFFLAGLGVLGGEDIEAHRTWGFTVMHILPLLMFGVAISVKAGRVTIGMTLLLFVLVGLQSLWVDFDPMWVRSIHVLSALVIYVLGHHIAQRAGRLPARPVAA
jgi:Family of unknown function (DUF6220)